MEDRLCPLPAGTVAPPFALPRSQNERLVLSDAAGRPVVLVFYPGDWEPASTEQLGRFQRYLEDFERLGAVLVAISPDSVWSHRAFARAQDLHFPLLSDVQPHGAVARAYGVWLEAEVTCGRALFVIDGKGIIRWSRSYSLNLVPSLDPLLATVERLRQA
jgi:peroxiredoxin